MENVKLDNVYNVLNTFCKDWLSDCFCYYPNFIIVNRRTVENI